MTYPFLLIHSVKWDIYNTTSVLFVKINFTIVKRTKDLGKLSFGVKFPQKRLTLETLIYNKIMENCHLNHKFSNLVEKNMNFLLDHLKHSLSLNSQFKRQLNLIKPN